MNKNIFNLKSIIIAILILYSIAVTVILKFNYKIIRPSCLVYTVNIVDKNDKPVDSAFVKLLNKKSGIIFYEKYAMKNDNIILFSDAYNFIYNFEKPVELIFIVSKNGISDSTYFKFNLNENNHSVKYLGPKTIKLNQ